MASIAATPTVCGMDAHIGKADKMMVSIAATPNVYGVDIHIGKAD